MSTTLITGSPWRVLLAFSVPLVIGGVVQQMYHFVDAIVVGRFLGVDALASVGATGSMIFLLIGFALGIGSGFVIPTAQAFGARDHAAVRRSVATGTILTAAVSIVLTIAAPFATGPLLALLQTPPELLQEATVFAEVSFLGGSAVMFFNYLSAVIRAIGDSRTPLVFLVIACALNIAFVILMVAVLGWGVGGAAGATVAAQAVAVALCLLYVWRRLPVLHVRKADWRVGRTDLVDHLRLGLPMGFQASLIALGSLTVQVALNTLGPDAVAAFTIAMRPDGIAQVFIGSLGLAVSMFAAQNLGARRPDRIRRGVGQALRMVVVIAVVLGALIIAFGPAVVGLFIGDASREVASMAALALTFSGVSYILLGVLHVLRGALQGLGYTFAPTVTGVSELLMRALAAFVLAGILGFPGVVLSSPLAWVGAVVILVPAYRRALRDLAQLPVDPIEITPTTAMPIIGPVDNPLASEALVSTPGTATGAIPLPGATAPTVETIPDSDGRSGGGSARSGNTVRRGARRPGPGLPR